MALRQTIAVILIAIGLGTATYGITPTTGLAVGGLTLAVLAAALLVDLDEESDT